MFESIAIMIACLWFAIVLILSAFRDLPATCCFADGIFLAVSLAKLADLKGLRQHTARMDFGFRPLLLCVLLQFQALAEPWRSRLRAAPDNSS
jgi:hypothetical protein